MQVEALLPGTRVQFNWAPWPGTKGTVVRHEKQHVSGQRRIRVKWDTGKESVVSSLRLREIDER